MKKGNFDIATVPKNGYLIFPLSMSRLSNAQAPSLLYEFLKFFETKIKVISLDVIFLYTNDLYLSVEGRAIEIRKKVLHQMINHKTEFLSILFGERKYVPSAFHFLPWDYAVLNSERFSELHASLVKAKKENKGFQEALLRDLKKAGREETDANINFLIEEIIVSHLLAQKEIPLPHTLTIPDGYRLICYPGNPLFSWVYAYQNNLVPKRTDLPEGHLLFARSFYNIDNKILIDFDSTNLEDLS